MACPCQDELDDCPCKAEIKTLRETISLQKEMHTNVIMEYDRRIENLVGALYVVVKEAASR